MLTEKEVELLCIKMRERHIKASQIAREIGVSRQAIFCTLHRLNSSKKIESFLREFLKK